VQTLRYWYQTYAISRSSAEGHVCVRVPADVVFWQEAVGVVHLGVWEAIGISVQHV
jgi:hypothetical protein